MMTMEQLTLQSPGGGNLILCSVTSSGFGNRRKVEPRELGLPEGVSEEMFSASKKLLDAKELRDVNTCINNFVNYIKRKSVPASSLLKKGVYAVGTEEVAAEIYEKYREFKSKDGELAQKKAALREAYPARREEARKKLTDENGVSFFDPEQYPSVDGLCSKFDVRVRFFTMSLPGINGISSEQNAELRCDLTELVRDARVLLRNELLDFTNNLSESLDLKPGKKKGRIYDTTVNKLVQYLVDFSNRNPIAKDSELQEIVKQISEVMTGIDAKALRDSDYTRMKVKEGLDSVAGKIKTLAEECSMDRDIVIE
jgi:hypothetical protein